MSKIPKKVGLAESFEGSFAIERLKRLEGRLVSAMLKVPKCLY